MDALVLKIKDYIDSKILLIGLGGVVGFYVLVFGYSMAAGPSFLAEIEAHMPQKTVAISGENSHADIALPDEAEHGEPAHGQSAHTAPKDGAHHSGHEGHMAKAAHDIAVDMPEKYKAVQQIKGLSQRSAVGVLPVVRKNDGLTPFDGYRRAFHIPEGMVGVALAFTDIGLSKSLSMQAIDTLPEGVSMIVSPYADNLKALQRSISTQGHEMWMSIPVEDIDYPMSEPGPHGILSRSSYDHNREQLFWGLSQIHGYAGVAMYTDGAFSSSRNIITSLAELVFERGLGYADLNANAPYGVDVMAARLNGAYLQNSLVGRDILFDEVVDIVESHATAKKIPVVVLPATPVNLTSVAEWVEGIEGKGIALVPLSAATGVAGDPPLGAAGEDSAPPDAVEDSPAPGSHSDEHKSGH